MQLFSILFFFILCHLAHHCNYKLVLYKYTHSTVLCQIGSFVVALQLARQFFRKAQRKVSHFTSLRSVNGDAPLAFDSVSRLKHYMPYDSTRVGSHLPSIGAYPSFFLHIPHDWQGVYITALGVNHECYPTLCRAGIGPHRESPLFFIQSGFKTISQYVSTILFLIDL